MTSVNSKNIFDVVKKKYAPNQPEKNHKIDPVYSLFDRDDPLPKCQELAFFTDTSICTGCKACEVACKQWNQLESDPYHWSGDSYDNTGDLSANNWRHVKFIVRTICRSCDRSRRSSADGCSLFRYLFQFYVGDYRVCRRPRTDLLRSGVFRKTSFLQNQFHIGYCKRTNCLHNRYALVEADRTILIFQ